MDEAKSINHERRDSIRSSKPTCKVWRNKKRGTCLQVPRSSHDIARIRHACPTANSGSGASGRTRIFDAHTRGRMMRTPGRFVRSTRAHMNHVGDGVPLTIELADLLLVYLQRQNDLVVTLRSLRVHDGYIECAPGSRIQDTHQRPLGIAIANVEGLHLCSP